MSAYLMSEIKKKYLIIVQPKSGFWFWLKKIMAKWYEFPITWRTFLNHSIWQPTDHPNRFWVIKIKYRASGSPNFQRNCSRKCICWFKNKNTQAYTRRMGEPVLRSYSHQQGHHKKRMTHIWDNQSN